MYRETPTAQRWQWPTILTYRYGARRWVLDYQLQGWQIRPDHGFAWAAATTIGTDTPKSSLVEFLAQGGHTIRAADTQPKD